MMSPDEFARAEALALRRALGDRARVMIARRIETLSAAGDWNEVARFKAIAAHLGQEMHGGKPAR